MFASIRMNKRINFPLCVFDRRQLMLLNDAVLLFCFYFCQKIHLCDQTEISILPISSNIYLKRCGEEQIDNNNNNNTRSTTRITNARANKSDFSCGWAHTINCVCAAPHRICRMTHNISQCSNTNNFI